MDLCPQQFLSLMTFQSQQHYDVLVLDTGLGALSGAALLARRGWRVLVLGGEHPSPQYRFAEFSLARRPFVFLAQASPVWQRMLAELAQGQHFARRLLPLTPGVQILGPGVRFTLNPSCDGFADDLARAFPESGAWVAAWIAKLATFCAAGDTAFRKDIGLPPTGFWERMEAEWTLSGLVGVHSHPSLDPMESLAGMALPKEAPFRHVLKALTQFGSYTESPSLFATSRLHRAWTPSLSALTGGEEELTLFLCDRVLAHGGEVRRGESAKTLLHKRGAVSGAQLDGGERTVGCDFLLTSRTHRELLGLARDFPLAQQTLAGPNEHAPLGYRYVLSVVVRREGVPAALGQESFLFSQWDSLDAASDDAPALPSLTVHLQRHEGAPHPEGVVLLVAELFLQDPTKNLVGVRERVLALLERFLPFVERHYLLIDSPHDGLPLWDLRSGKRVEVPRAQLQETGGSVLPEPMRPQWRMEPQNCFGWGGDPLHALLRGVFLVGPGTLPALGQEGELLAAWGAARAIGKTDRRREKLQRSMWSPTEL